MVNHFLPGTVWIQFSESSSGWGRSERKGDRAVRVLGQRGGCVVLARERLTALKFRPGLRVVDDDRPEVLGGDVGWDCELVVLGAIEVLAGGVVLGVGVLRSDAGNVQCHGRGVHGREVEEHCSRVEVASTDAIIAEPAVVVADERGLPTTVRILVRPGVAGLEGDGAGGAVGDRDGFGEQGAHAVVWRERGALADSDRGEQPTRLVVDQAERLTLDDCVQLVEERDIVGVDRVERSPPSEMNSISGGASIWESG